MPEPSMKICTRCQVVQPVTNFHVNKGNKSGLDSWCKSCRYEYNTTPERRETNAEYRRLLPEDQKLDTRLRYLYGITLDDFNRMVDIQGGVCAICKQSPEPNTRLHVDHDHGTGVVRGLLCRKCNIAMGLFSDDITIMTAAIQYLEHPMTVGNVVVQTA